MAKLIAVATQIKDMYFQNYPSNDSFIDIRDFKDQIANTYSSMLDALFQQERKYIKSSEGYSSVEIPPAWTITEDLIISHSDIDNRFFVKTSNPIFSFSWDANVYALQPISGVGNSCNNKPCNYRRITLYEKQFLGIIPPVSVIFYVPVSSREIDFVYAKKDAKVKVSYIPSVVAEDDNCLLSDSILGALIDEVLLRMFKAKSGNFVDKVNDQNPNIIPAQQTNKSLN